MNISRFHCDWYAEEICSDDEFGNHAIVQVCKENNDADSVVHRDYPQITMLCGTICKILTVFFKFLGNIIDPRMKLWIWYIFRNIFAFLYWNFVQNTPYEQNRYAQQFLCSKIFPQIGCFCNTEWKVEMCIILALFLLKPLQLMKATVLGESSNILSIFIMICLLQRCLWIVAR